MRSDRTRVVAYVCNGEHLNGRTGAMLSVLLLLLLTTDLVLFFGAH